MAGKEVHKNNKTNNKMNNKIKSVKCYGCLNVNKNLKNYLVKEIKLNDQ